MSEPQSPSKKSFFGLGKEKKEGSGLKTPTHEIAQTPALESANPLEKHNIPSEARQQQIVGQTGEGVTKESSILIAIDGTEAGDKAFHYLLKSKVLSTNAHIFIVTILPANVLSGPWVSGPLSIDTKRQNEMLKALREQALQKLTPYRDQLREAGYETTLHVAHGDPRQTIVRVSSYHKVDLALVGKRGKKGISGLTGGSTSSYIVNHSPCPVLVIK
ncbi:adenine nucleotide alpha hydrolases-like protein [Jaminaea rosea]|uniref:Adenine nucleotide alpha hydrolases-like protein n=1 Tax=Jaminaea rosea TaxID=1569628 RepID=A0A316UVM1_9BASI|nr:adenine nucleotide alpha hydrolases-like protein [Jaminaea rosea]PWN29347.1 adenine nucleotide alpha hydrolases-like protein [Jaminaea rosea]